MLRGFAVQVVRGAALALCLPGCRQPGLENVAGDRVEIQLDVEEAEVALDLVSQAKGQGPIPSDDWRRLVETVGYQRLERREREMGRSFEAADFEKFILSDDLVREAPAIRKTLDAWKKADLRSAALRVLAYLPAEARIRATVFAVVKPKKNSFVFEPATNPAIFLYVDPSLSRDQFENTVAHELHHIGFASLPARESEHPPEVEKGFDKGIEDVLTWVGAFGEGFAMLAAAGGPDVHPHEHSSPADRDRWDRDVARSDQDLRKIETFFLDVLDGRLTSDDEIRKAGFEFFGEQGPWYTVGWKMSVVVEKRYGRAVLIESMRRPERLLATYNEAAAETNARGGGQLALWSPELLRRIGAESLAPSAGG